MQKAFTMAEILLSLTIIGIVAAITLPSLTGNINERTWNTQRKALYARFSQALALMPSLNGYGTLTEESAPDAGDAVDTAAETFVTSGLAKVMKINNICDNEHLEDCGIPNKITPWDNESLINLQDILTLQSFNDKFTSQYGIKQDTKAAAFETANGESILVYYNPNCQGDLNETGSHSSQPKMCANFVYDLNGKKGPNTVGKDIGSISAIFPVDSLVVAPIPAGRYAKDGSDGNFEIARKRCASLDDDSRLPNKYELAAMFYNKKLLGVKSSNGIGYHWSSSVITSGASGKAWALYVGGGNLFPLELTSSISRARCIKR